MSQSWSRWFKVKLYFIKRSNYCRSILGSYGIYYKWFLINFYPNSQFKTKASSWKSKDLHSLSKASIIELGSSKKRRSIFKGFNKKYLDRTSKKCGNFMRDCSIIQGANSKDFLKISNILKLWFKILNTVSWIQKI